jgi:hypothetical protein
MECFRDRKVETTFGETLTVGEFRPAGYSFRSREALVQPDRFAFLSHPQINSVPVVSDAVGADFYVFHLEKRLIF